MEQVSRIHGMACQRQCGSIVTKLSRSDAREDRKVVRWCRALASSYNLQGGIDEAGMSTVKPDSAQYSVVEWTRARVVIQYILI